MEGGWGHVYVHMYEHTLISKIQPVTFPQTS